MYIDAHPSLPPHATHASVSCGVPQGSPLGALLFTLYINDLPFVSDRKVWNLYADDTAIIYSSNSPADMEST